MILKYFPREEINSTFGEGNTALHLASYFGENDTISMLLSFGADPSIKNNLGYNCADVSCDKETRLLFDSVANNTASGSSNQEGSRRKSATKYKIRKSCVRQENSSRKSKAGQQIDEDEEGISDFVQSAFNSDVWRASFGE